MYLQFLKWHMFTCFWGLLLNGFRERTELNGYISFVSCRRQIWHKKHNGVIPSFQNQDNQFFKMRLTRQASGQLLQDYPNFSAPSSPSSPKHITILGSTGNVGTQVLDVVSRFPSHFKIVGLAAGTNIKTLLEQIEEFRPEIVSIANPGAVQELEATVKLRYGSKAPIVRCGTEGSQEVAAYGSANIVVSAIVGWSGILPTIAAIKSKKDIALANKETLISAGSIILPLVKEMGVKLLPCDSEHSAIFQCLQGAPSNSIKKLILTASGGAFRDWSVTDLQFAKLEDALKHPNWSMGTKITIDSATLMNKGLEVIEAHFLFGVPYDKIDAVIHPQSIIHSLVEYQDTAILAQLGTPDMRLPLLYALSWPSRVRTPFKSLDLLSMGALTFSKLDIKKYPCFDLCNKIGRLGGNAPAALSAANEVLVNEFCKKRIQFVDIPAILTKVMELHHQKVFDSQPSLENIIQTIRWAERQSEEEVKLYEKRN